MTGNSRVPNACTEELIDVVSPTAALTSAARADP